jgi:hypothetical protein
MQKSSIVTIVCGILLIGVIGIIVRILPDAIYVHDYTANDHAYVMKYGNMILTSYGDMTVDSSAENGDSNALILKYKQPGEKGENFRETLSLSGDTATFHRLEYSRISSWNIFEPTLYKGPFEYFLTIFMLR